MRLLCAECGIEHRLAPPMRPQANGMVERPYLREPGGNLFELATAYPPGFAVDEPFETTGRSLSLPPFLEGRRAQIEAGLKPLD